MSTDSGDKAVANAALGETKAIVDAAAAEEEQLDLLEPLTAEEIYDARETLGPLAGLVAVQREARARRGRPKGSRNKRTDDFARYISQFGRDPAITLMEIQSTPPEELVARSQLLDPIKRRMSFGDALSLKVRCAEALMPFIHAKKPVAIDATIRGVMIVEEVGGRSAAHGVTIDADPIGVLPMDDEGSE